MRYLYLVLASILFSVPVVLHASTITNDQIKNILIDNFGTSSPMISIAYCESSFRQFDLTGKVLKGMVNPLDHGLFQINLKYHQKQAESMGLDVDTIEGNVKYAKWLFETQGTSPWLASMPCWK